MTTPDASTRSVVVEKEFPHPPERVWRALTESSLMEQWLMKNDFQPAAGHPFTLRTDPMPNWNGIINCRVLAVEPCRTLSYTWGALGMESAVAFTLTPTNAGTHVRMEQSGFRPDQEANFKGAQYGWQRFIGGLERVVAGLEERGRETEVTS
jgi:uncharacterized protein YndB with AHSA1/START domain